MSKHQMGDLISSYSKFIEVHYPNAKSGLRKAFANVEEWDKELITLEQKKVSDKKDVLPIGKFISDEHKLSQNESPLIEQNCIQVDNTNVTKKFLETIIEAFGPRFHKQRKLQHNNIEEALIHFKEICLLFSDFKIESIASIKESKLKNTEKLKIGSEIKKSPTSSLLIDSSINFPYLLLISALDCEFCETVDRYLIAQNAYYSNKNSDLPFFLLIEEQLNFFKDWISSIGELNKFNFDHLQAERIKLASKDFMALNSQIEGSNFISDLKIYLDLTWNYFRVFDEQDVESTIKHPDIQLIPAFIFEAYQPNNKTAICFNIAIYAMCKLLEENGHKKAIESHIMPFFAYLGIKLNSGQYKQKDIVEKLFNERGENYFTTFDCIKTIWNIKSVTAFYANPFDVNLNSRNFPRTPKPRTRG